MFYWYDDSCGCFNFNIYYFFKRATMNFTDGNNATNDENMRIGLSPGSPNSQS